MGSVRRSIMSKPMTKTQLVAALADEMGSDKKSAGAALDAVCNIITRDCLLYTSPSPRDRQKSRMPSSA